ncbi:MAG: hypothetical protein NVS3B5_05330 [Sphingomicrobium sp.]
MTTRNHLLLAATLTSGVLLSAPAAANRWENHHPRRDQVLDRVQHQDRRIRDERREGDITKAQARALRATDRSIRLQQRADARANDGHITRAEQHTLNQELNANSNAIGK